jgi:Na+/H+-dicarboxylate symporter
MMNTIFPITNIFKSVLFRDCQLKKVMSSVKRKKGVRKLDTHVYHSSTHRSSSDEQHPVAHIHPRSLKYLSKKLRVLVESKLWLKVVISMIFGLLTGLFIGPSAGFVRADISKIIAEWFSLPAIIFLRIIQMIVIPLIFASVIRGIAASEDIQQLKKMGMYVLLYFVLTSLVAICIGLFLAFLIEPGNYVAGTLQIDSAAEASLNTAADDVQHPPTFQNLPALITSVLPANIFGSVLNGEMLPIVIFSIIFGIALVSISAVQSRPLLEVLGSLQDVCMTIVKWAMLLAPLAVYGLMVKLASQFGLDMLFGVGVYAVTVLVGLIFLFFFYLAVVYFSSRITPWDFISRVKENLLLAFSTSSSAAVMPLSIKTSEEKLNVRASVSQFVIPIGATINMDGTALYQVVATLFLAQVYGVELHMVALLFLIVTIVGASIGSPGTPGMGIVILSVILSGLGIPLSGLGLILSVDRILDMCRTTVNVTGDLAASTFINRFTKNPDTSVTKVRQREAKIERFRKKEGRDVVVTQPTGKGGKDVTIVTNGKHC